jgi:hypothetical protein
MSSKDDPVISAQALLKPASGVMPRDTDITAANIRALAPAPEAVAEVQRAFADAGFESGPVVGLSFSVTGRRSLFNRFFGIRSAGTTKGVIPLERVPDSVRRHLSAITFPPPPDFGPGSY